jgi:uncharacterized protein with HEPN domain
MISLDEKKLLLDIIESINSIDQHLGNKRVYKEYSENKTIRRAVEREIEIIGEAMSKILKINSSIKISNSRFIVDLRNKVIHSYDAVDDVLIWKIIMKDLPILFKETNELLYEN